MRKRGFLIFITNVYFQMNTDGFVTHVIILFIKLTISTKVRVKIIIYCNVQTYSMYQEKKQ